MSIPQSINKLLKGAGFIIAGIIGGALIIGNIKDKAYQELLKKHDKETAERMAKEFEAKLEQIKEEYKDNEKKMNRKMKRLCKQFGIDSEVVFDV
jgi:membrane protein insertase Oxa1/YidC/SpoIIIJ